MNADTNAVNFPANSNGASLSMSSGLCQQHAVAGDHFSTNGASILPDSDDVMAFPPPPPAQLLKQQDITVVDSDDEFPLPPPPDMEMTTPQISQAVHLVKPAGRHPDLLQSLNVKLAERGTVQMRPGPPVAAKHYRMTVAEHQQSMSHATAAAALPIDANFLSQIRRGVSLRRTISNDRSAPRFQGKRV